MLAWKRDDASLIGGSSDPGRFDIANAASGEFAMMKTNPIASDIMTKHPLTLSPLNTLGDALQTMVENHVTGLPVVDDAGHCLGVITATDILSYEQDHSEEHEEANAEIARYFNHEQRRWESLRASTFALEHFGHIPVSDLMTGSIISAHADASVTEVARIMIDHDVHRVMIVDQKQRLLGTVSTVDIVRMIADGALED